jgi:hypothetical protein
MEFFSFRHRVQTGSGDHPAFHATSTGALSLELKRPPSSAEVKNAWSCTSSPSIRLHGVVLNYVQRLYLYLYLRPRHWERLVVGFEPHMSSADTCSTEMWWAQSGIHVRSSNQVTQSGTSCLIILSFSDS